MRLRNRAGHAAAAALAAVIVLVVVALLYVAVVNPRLSKVEEAGRELTAWIGAVDGPENNATGGLTTYLIHLKTEVVKHMNQQAHPNGPAHAPAGGHMHLDPPPPPPW